MNTRPIIIHVPKTGGTTLFMAISGSNKPPKPNLLYRHIQMFGENEEMKSNCGDLFDLDVHSTYENQKIILMVRDPIERIESEYGFLSNREMFRELWMKNVHAEYPKSLLEYIQHPSNANSICRFLLGIPMYTNEVVTKQQFENIILTFDKLQFVFGRTDKMSDTVANVSHACNIDFGDAIPRYRTSLYKPKRSDKWEHLTDTFNSLNEYDNKLVDEIHKRFNEQMQLVPNSSAVHFEGDKYDSVYPFVCANNTRFPLEIYANDLDSPEELYSWIEENQSKLMPTLQECLQNNNGNGKAFLIEWLTKSIPMILDGDTLDVHASDPLQTLRELVEKKFAR